MKKLTILIILFFSSKTLLAQTLYKTIYQDTIHLRGIVLDFKGNPVSHVFLESSGHTLDGKGYLLSTTDSLGKFMLTGAKANDTISIWWPFGNMKVYNNGSRYIEITLPAIKTQSITASNAITVTSRRKIIRDKIPIKIEINNDFWTDSGGIIGDHIAEFAVGMDKFINFIRKNLIYPKQAVDKNIEGVVKVGFSVYKDGSLNHFKIIRGLGYGCDEEVINILKTSPKWKPGIINGRPVISLETVSVQFKLTDK